MKFRHPNGVRLALTTGHVTIVGPEWRLLLEMFHREALANGCECDQRTIRTTTHVPAASPQAVKQVDERDAIRTAIIKMLERASDPTFGSDFTAAGTPNINTLAGLCGFRVDKDSALTVWGEMQAEADAEAEKEAQAAADAESARVAAEEAARQADGSTASTNSQP